MYIYICIYIYVNIYVYICIYMYRVGGFLGFSEKNKKSGFFTENRKNREKTTKKP